MVPVEYRCHHPSGEDEETEKVADGADPGRGESCHPRQPEHPGLQSAKEDFNFQKKEHSGFLFKAHLCVVFSQRHGKRSETKILAPQTFGNWLTALLQTRSSNKYIFITNI